MTIVRNFVVCSIALSVAFLIPALADDPGAEKEGKVAKTQEKLSTSIQKTAARIDNFFSNERHNWSANKTRVTLRGNFDWIDDLGWEFNPEFKLFLALPGLNNRLRVVANDDDDNGAADGAPKDQDESDVALRYIGKQTRKGGYSFDLGLSTRDSDLQSFVRFNLFGHYSLGNNWAGRSENRLYWYTSAGLRNDSRQYFERRLSDNWFFRSRTRLQYEEDKNEGWYPEQKFTLFQRISDRSVLAYEVIARQYCDCDPVYPPEKQLVQADRYNLFMARLRFRRNAFYPWLFFELWPGAAWPEERDYEFTPAIRFRLEVVLGTPPKKTVLIE
ncbi:hypothetical protein ACFL1S_06105 [Pseudomonadota bacterium]